MSNGATGGSKRTPGALSDLFARVGSKFAYFAAEHDHTHRVRRHVPSRPSIERQLRALLANANALWFVLDDDGCFSAASGALLQMLNVPEKDLVGRNHADFFFGADSTVIRGGTCSVAVRTADGVDVAAELQVSVIDGGEDVSLKVGLLTLRGAEEAREATPSRPAVTFAGGVPGVEESREDEADKMSGAIRARLAGERPPYRLTAGRIELISLDEVKAALGPRWPAQAELAKAIARGVISKRLAAADVFAEAEDDRFIICFASLGTEAAKLKADLITREIHERLLGERARVYTVVSQVGNVRLDEEQVTHGHSLVEALTSQLDEVRTAGRRATEKMAERLLNSATLKLSPVLSKSLVPTGISVARISGTGMFGLAGVAASEDAMKWLFELDALILALALKHIYESFTAGRAPSIIVPVNFSTLREPRLVRAYMDMCRSIDQPARAGIRFEVHGLAPDVPPLRLQEILACLAPFSTHRIIRATDAEHRFADLKRFRLSMVSIAASPAHLVDQKGSRAYDGFLAMVRNSGTASIASGNGCSLLVRDVNDLETARWYLSRGADFVSLAGGAHEAETGIAGPLGERSDTSAAPR